MRYDDDLLRAIFNRDGGRCHLCGSLRAFRAHGKRWMRGHWEPDHSNPSANGGTDLFRNLRVACVCCNRAKGAMSTRAFRHQMGYEPAARDDWTGALLFWGGLLLGAAVLNRLRQSPTSN